MHLAVTSVTRNPNCSKSKIGSVQPVVEGIRGGSTTYRLVRSTELNGFAHTLVFVSGWSCPMVTTWDPLIPLLSKRHNLLFVEKRGQATSNSGKSTPSTYLDDVAYDVRIVMGLTGTTKATLVGHSMGGYVAERLHALFPGLVSSMVFVSSPFTNPLATWFFGHSSPVRLAAHTIPRFLVGIPGADFVKEALLAQSYLGKSGVKLLLRDVVMHEKGVLNGAFDTFYSELIAVPLSIVNLQLAAMLCEPYSRELPDYGVPVLYVGGAIDPLVSPDLLPPMPGFAKLILPNIGHLPSLECPEVLANAISDFVARET